MLRVVHVVVTDNFAGVERYVCDVANELAHRGHAVTVVGGHGPRVRLELERSVRCLPGRNVAEALVSLARLGRQDVCHVHMTLAEAVGIAGRLFHRAPVVSSRHFAHARGASALGSVVAGRISRGLAREIAVSRFVAERTERPPDAVVPNGVPESPKLWSLASRTVLVAQRLEPEKDTLTALRAWRASGLASEGWSLRIAGDGSERGALEEWSAARGLERVAFAGWATDMSAELRGAALLLAPAPADSFGLGVVEAMAAGVPVVAAAGGGHLETAGLLRGALFEPGDGAAAASVLRSFVSDRAREAASDEARRLAAARFTMAGHLDRLLAQYAEARRSPAGPALDRAFTGAAS